MRRNADTDHQVGLTHVAMEEGMEGARAFAQKRPPEFDKYVQHH